MSRYVFRAKDWNGKMIKGVLDLPRRSEVVTSIKDHGLVPLSVLPERKGLLEELEN